MTDGADNGAWGTGPAGGPSPADEGGEDVQEAEEDGAGFARGRGGEFEFEEVEASEALDGGATSDRVVTGTVTRGGAAGAFGDVERDGDRRAVELVGELGAAERQPPDDDAPELQGELVGVEAVERRLRGGEHRLGPFREEGRD